MTTIRQICAACDHRWDADYLTPCPRCARKGHVSRGLPLPPVTRESWEGIAEQTREAAKYVVS